MSSVRPRRALVERTVVLSKSTQQQKGEAIRTKLYGKYGKLIVTAVKEGGGADPVANTQLARVLADASRLSVPRDLIERNIKRLGESAPMNSACQRYSKINRSAQNPASA